MTALQEAKQAGYIRAEMRHLRRIPGGRGWHEEAPGVWSVDLESNNGYGYTVTVWAWDNGEWALHERPSGRVIESGRATV